MGCNEVKKMIKNVLPYGIVEWYRKKKFCGGPVGNVPEPQVYNANGEKMRVFYLQDKAALYAYSFTGGRDSTHIFWDRSNVRLPIHFYTHEDMFDTKAIAQKKFGLLMEPEVMIPQVYQRLYENPGLVKEFDAIFTHSEKLLEKYDNAKLYLGQGAWYGTLSGGGVPDSELYRRKCKNVSMVSSDKVILESHRRRIEIAKAMKQSGVVDTFGAFDGGPEIKVADALDEYRFSIVLENEISSYYFTEKILNCFASMTIPVYAGATKIGDFFNEEGIIVIDKTAPMDDIIVAVKKLCTKEAYEERKDAVIDNYNRVQKMLCVDDYIYENYKELF